MVREFLCLAGALIAGWIFGVLTVMRVEMWEEERDATGQLG